MNKQKDTCRHLSLACVTLVFPSIFDKFKQCSTPKWVYNLHSFKLSLNLCLRKQSMETQKEIFHGDPNIANLFRRSEAALCSVRIKIRTWSNCCLLR